MSIDLEKVWAAMNFTGALGIYIHIPFCEKKCDYCDFFSIVSPKQIGKYVTALIAEINFIGKALGKIPVNTVFMGGGTPSLLNCNELEAIAEALRNNFTLGSDLEWTLEANPGTVDKEKLSCYREAGVNRLSFGVQSFVDSELRFLGRIHTAKEGVDAIMQAKCVGFDNISIDLMSGFHGQSPASYQLSLRKAVSLNLSHVSCYTLIIEEGTPIFGKVQRGEIEAFPEEQELLYYRMANDILAEGGFERYEISNFSHKTGLPCKHNLKYWQLEPYFGFGAAAHAYTGKYRYANVKNVKKYISNWTEGNPAVAFTEEIDTQKAMFEYIFLGLRTVSGIRLKSFYRKFSRDFKEMYDSLITELVESSLAEIDDEYFRLTDYGLELADAISAKF